MKRFVSVLLTIAFALGLSMASMAQSTRTPVINKREHRQQQRIRQGVRSGSLTKREAAKLETQQAVTHAEEAAAKADGKVTRNERRHIRHRELRTSRSVYRQKHDSQTRKP
jgi:uncharacterized membrane protein YebE (DUF533 family)